MTTTNDDARHAAQVLLAHLGLTAEDLLWTPPPTIPTIAEYLPAVIAASGPGARRTYSTYWNRILDTFGLRQWHPGDLHPRRGRRPDPGSPQSGRHGAQTPAAAHHAPRPAPRQTRRDQHNCRDHRQRQPLDTLILRLLTEPPAAARPLCA